MTQYQKECMYCKQQITMSDQTGKWLPYNKEGSSHDCRTNGKQDQQAPAPAKQNGQQQLEQEQKGPTLEQFKIWLKRLDDVGVHIDFNEIIKPKKDQKEKEKQK